MYNKEFYNVWNVDENRSILINNERAYLRLEAIYSTMIKRSMTNKQAYFKLKPMLESIIYHAGIDKDTIRIYKGWKHDLAKTLVNLEYEGAREVYNYNNK